MIVFKIKISYFILQLLQYLVHNYVGFYLNTGSILGIQEIILLFILNSNFKK